MTAPTDEREELATIVQYWARGCLPILRGGDLEPATAEHLCGLILAAGYRRPTPPGQDLARRAQRMLETVSLVVMDDEAMEKHIAAEFAEVEKAAVERCAVIANKFDADSYDSYDPVRDVADKIAKAIRSAGI